VVLKETAKNTLDCEKNKSFNTGRGETRSLIGSINNEAEAQIFWPHNAKTRIIGENPDAWKNRRQP